MANPVTKRGLALIILIAAFIWLIASAEVWETTLRFFFPDETRVLHPRATLMVLVWEHLRLVIVSSGIIVAIGVPLGIWVTRPGGRDFLPIVNDLTSFGQTFPPVAVLALTVPMLGFGFLPTIAALFLYGMLPVVRNTIAGLNAVSADLLEAAYGMGMSRSRALFRIEIPLAARVILAGIRTSVIINIGTAMIGAVIGAGGLGSPIIAGLVQDNIAYIIEGAVPAALLAVIADQFLASIEGILTYSPTKT
ncbi:MAG: ABC transporter permease [Dehalococcoidales bacterium]|nr:ABC transporter permease [Dehalococcoidales bacterium]MDZ4230281.1 ABC transporter permease [Dehalococcoidales bacterium]